MCFFFLTQLTIVNYNLPKTARPVTRHGDKMPKENEDPIQHHPSDCAARRSGGRRSWMFVFAPQMDYPAAAFACIHCAREWALANYGDRAWLREVPDNLIELIADIPELIAEQRLGVDASDGAA